MWEHAPRPRGAPSYVSSPLGFFCLRFCCNFYLIFLTRWACGYALGALWALTSSEKTASSSDKTARSSEKSASSSEKTASSSEKMVGSSEKARSQCLRGLRKFKSERERGVVERERASQSLRGARVPRRPRVHFRYFRDGLNWIP